MNIGQSIKVALVKSGHDPKWLAGKMGAGNTQTVYNLMKQESCQLKTAERIAKIFDMSTGDFISLSEETLKTKGAE